MKHATPSFFVCPPLALFNISCNKAWTRFTWRQNVDCLFPRTNGFLWCDDREWNKVSYFSEEPLLLFVSSIKMLEISFPESVQVALSWSGFITTSWYFHLFQTCATDMLLTVYRTDFFFLSAMHLQGIRQLWGYNICLHLLSSSSSASPSLCPRWAQIIFVPIVSDCCTDAITGNRKEIKLTNDSWRLHLQGQRTMSSYCDYPALL